MRLGSGRELAPLAAQAACFCWVAGVVACSRAPESRDRERPSTSAAVSVEVPGPPANAPPPALLYLPDGGDKVEFGVAPELAPGLVPPSSRCPAEMVDVRGRFCIDRYEALLVDQKQGRRLSPYYHPTRAQTVAAFKEWSHGSAGQALSVPAPPDFQLSEEFEPRAESQASVTPSGYLSGNASEIACRGAGKRLCTSEEWVFACRGEAGRKFP